jgi:hypothetical protein
MRLALTFATILALHAQTQPVPQDPEKARLEGIVLNSATGEPLRKTTLTLLMNAAAPAPNQPKPPQTTYTITSDVTGKFEFANVDPGDYQLTARREGFAEAHLGNTGNGRRVEPILLNRSDRKTNFTVKLVPYGALTGVTLDEDGDPIRNLRVSAMTWRYTTNGRELAEVRSTQSNDLGEFRIFDLPAGRYLVKINPAQFVFDRDIRIPSESYAAVFYPGVMDAAQAIRQDLAPGQQLRGLTFNLRKVHAATIRGKVIAPPDATKVEAGRLIYSEGSSTSTSGGVDNKTGKFMLPYVPPGSIYLTGSFVQDGKRYDTILPIEVGYADIDGIELRPIGPSDIAGRISVADDPAFDVTHIGITLNGASAGHQGSSNSPTVKADGTFVLPGVTPGFYRVNLSRLQSLYIKSVRFGFTDMTDVPLDLSGGVPPRSEFAIVLGNDGGEITGTVQNEKSEPVDGAEITLLPAGSTRRVRSYFRTATADASGHFTLRGVAPGSYRILAWDHVDANAVFYDPEFLKPYEGAGQNLEVQSKGKHTAELKLTLNKDSDERSR